MNALLCDLMFREWLFIATAPQWKVMCTTSVALEFVWSWTMLLQLGKQVEVDFFFAGILKAIHFTGIVTRVFDEIDDPGPRRMGIEIQSFASEADELRMNDLLESGSLGELR